MTTTYGILNRKHKDYDEAYWDQIDALVNGGKALSGPVLLKLLPSRPGEKPETYQKRLGSAFEVPTLNYLLTQLVSSVMSDPLHIEASTAGDFYTELMETVNPSANRQSINDFMRMQLFSATEFQSAWTLVDLPKIAEMAKNAAEEQASGVLNAYLCEIDPRSVYNMKKDDMGRLEWVIINNTTEAMINFDDQEPTITETFTLYTRTDWKRFTFVYTEKKKPAFKTEPTSTEEGKNTLGEVPLVHGCLPSYLYVCDKIFNLQVEIFRKENMLSWGIDKAVMPILFNKVENRVDAGEVSNSGSVPSLTSQPAGPGYVLQIAAGDELGYLSPNTDSFVVARANIEKLEEKLYRAVASMGLAVSNTAAAHQRSGESRTLDMSSFWMLVQALGGFVRDHVKSALEMVAKARKEAVNFEIHGCQHYEKATTETLLDSAQVVETLTLPSPAFRKDFSLDVIRRLRPTATPEDLEKYEAELNKGFSNEEINMQQQAMDKPRVTEDEQE